MQLRPTTQRARSSLGLAVVATAIAAAGYADAKANEIPAELTVTASEFAFRSPDSAVAGLTRVRLVNAGKAAHHVQFLRLAPGRTAKDYIAAVAAKDFAPAWVTAVGGPGVPASGDTSEVLMTLEPGQYMLLCYITDGKGTPHLMLGMFRQLTVVPSASGYRPEPAEDARMTLDDYSFTITPKLTAGRRIVRVENRAVQPHEAALVRLKPGVTELQFRAWLAKRGGQPPFIPVSGVMALGRGQVNHLDVELQRGAYALFCFVPDAEDGRPHVAHGMVQMLRVE